MEGEGEGGSPPARLDTNTYAVANGISMILEAASKRAPSARGRPGTPIPSSPTITTSREQPVAAYVSTTLLDITTSGEQPVGQPVPHYDHFQRAATPAGSECNLSPI